MTIGKLDGKSCKRLLMGFIAAMAMCATANTVKVTKFHQSYPYSGKATIEYTVSGELQQMQSRNRWRSSVVLSAL